MKFTRRNLDNWSAFTISILKPYPVLFGLLISDSSRFTAASPIPVFIFKSFVILYLYPDLSGSNPLLLIAFKVFLYIILNESYNTTVFPGCKSCPYNVLKLSKNTRKSLSLFLTCFNKTSSDASKYCPPNRTDCNKL